MNIENFTCEVVLVNEQNQHMEVIYSAEGYEPVRVGMPFPREGDDPVGHLRAYAPQGAWAAQRPAQPMALGKIEVAAAPPLPPEAAPSPMARITVETVDV